MLNATVDLFYRNNAVRLRYGYGTFGVEQHWFHLFLGERNLNLTCRTVYIWKQSAMLARLTR